MGCYIYQANYFRILSNEDDLCGYIVTRMLYAYVMLLLDDGLEVHNVVPMHHLYVMFAYVAHLCHSLL